ncbi:hypothetical protein [Microterricola viridarii]|uniref:Uncharacterized protein n=1 Tax=Microterricola viridarii TaxID=412690 RepID=A0A1H1P4A5_9MICO|nr:hypothetical protein [Microterricola viridarii]SDS06024.1 hypothetical protein SAMN04489834_0783 [Microterricola viridarii]
MTSTRWARFTRGWLVALFSVFVAALSHSFAGGVTPGWLAIVLSLAFAAMLSIGLSGPKCPAPGRTGPAPWRVVLSVAGSQIVFHGLFSLFGGQLAATPLAGTGHAGHHLSSAEIAAQLSAIAPAGIAPVLGSAHHDVWMLLGHTIAGLLTVAAILRGEYALRGLLRTAGLALSALAVRPIVLAPIPDAAPARPAVAAVWIPRPLDVVQSALRHRGPPVLARA